MLGFRKHAGKVRNVILLPQLFWSTVRKNWSNDREKLMKLKATGQEFANVLRSLEWFIQHNKRSEQFLVTECS